MSHASLVPRWQAAEEARQDADGRAQRAEAVAEQRRAEARNLEEWLRKTQEESNLSKARLDSFMKAMGSLQDDRDHILVAYKQLEEKHLQVRWAARILTASVGPIRRMKGCILDVSDGLLMATQHA